MELPQQRLERNPGLNVQRSTRTWLELTFRADATLPRKSFSFRDGVTATVMPSALKKMSFQPWPHQLAGNPGRSFVSGLGSKVAGP